MRLIHEPQGNFPPVVIAGARIASRDPESLQGLLIDADGVSQEAGCVRCPTPPCASSDLGRKDSLDLCPVGALTISSEDGSVEVGPDCIGCGICAIRCPIGALSVGRSVNMVSSTTKNVCDYDQPAPDVFDDWIKDQFVRLCAASIDREHFVTRAMLAAKPLQGRHFYPLVRSLFRAIGVRAELSNPGDTSNRIDLLLPDATDPIPVEIKSASEVDVINIKSVQQALENKLAISRLTNKPRLGAASSLVVGFEYPPDRSGVLELIEDINYTFAIRIGLISLRSLYEIFLSVSLDGMEFDRAKIANLKGLL